MERRAIANERAHRINAEISAPEIRLLGADGEQLGVVRTAEALRMAEEGNL
ncbi:MAG TPA: translation initiation factor IF-3, partial [Burkholderiaceae bacterium]|nr:translation initiation factor IF-3 [Burkholderiaceae bacterium]